MNSGHFCNEDAARPCFLPPLCICWHVWAPLALSNKLDSGYFPDCLLGKVLAHPRVFCSWLGLMGKLLRIIVLRKRTLPSQRCRPHTAACVCDCDKVTRGGRGEEGGEKKKEGTSHHYGICHRLCLTCVHLWPRCVIGARRGRIRFICRAAAFFFSFGLDSCAKCYCLCSDLYIRRDGCRKCAEYGWVMQSTDAICGEFLSRDQFIRSQQRGCLCVFIWDVNCWWIPKMRFDLIFLIFLLPPEQVPQFKDAPLDLHIKISLIFTSESHSHFRLGKALAPGISMHSRRSDYKWASLCYKREESTFFLLEVNETNLDTFFYNRSTVRANFSWSSRHRSAGVDSCGWKTTSGCRSRECVWTPQVTDAVDVHLRSDLPT